MGGRGKVLEKHGLTGWVQCDTILLLLHFDCIFFSPSTFIALPLFHSIFAPGPDPRVLRSENGPHLTIYMMIYWYLRSDCNYNRYVFFGGVEGRLSSNMAEWWICCCIFISASCWGTVPARGRGGGGALQLSESKRNTTVGAKSLPHSTRYEASCLSLTLTNAMRVWL